MIYALHGSFGGPGDWRGLAASGLSLEAVPLWEQVEGFGPWARRFCAAVRSGGGQAPAVLGYSLGGRLALHALLEEPGLWARAVIVSAHPGLEEGRERCERRQADARWARRVHREPLPEVLSAWEAQPVLAGPSMERDAECLQAHRQGLASSFREWSLGVQEPLWERLGEIACPVLWITGARDPAYGALAARAVAAMPRAEQLVIEGAGHRVPWEAPEVFAREVGRFFGSAQGCWK